jgi:tetratricopeptide (TPR) repeat protein
VKRPVLARLALDMTRRGVTREAADLIFLRKIGGYLKEIQAENEGILELEPFAFMPNPPAAKSLVEEAVDNGVLRHTAGGIEFLHETVRDFFAAVAMSALPLPDILSEVPVTRWSLGENAIQHAGRTALADALAIFSGLSEVSDPLVIGLLDKDLPLAAECLYGARATSDSVRQAVIERSLELLLGTDPLGQAQGCRCVLLGRLQTPAIVDALRDLASSESLPVALGALSAAAKFDLPAKRSVMIPALARTRLSATAIACMGLLREWEKAPMDLGLLLSIPSLVSGSHFSPGPDGDSEPSILEKVAALFSEEHSLDELIARIVQPGKSSEASLLIRLAYTQAAATRIGEMVSSSEAGDREFLFTAMLPIACGTSAVPVLMELVRNSGDRLARAAVAGVALGFLSRELLSKQESRIPFPELRQMLVDESLPPGPRLGAALAVIGVSEDRHRVLERYSGPAESAESRAVFCATVLMQPPQQPWLLSLSSFSGHGTVEEATGFLVGRALGDSAAEVRQLAAKALSGVGQGESRLLEKLDDTTAPASLRRAAAEALGAAGHTAARDRLLKLAFDPGLDPELLAGVIRGLAALLDDATEKTLDDMLLTGADNSGSFLPALILVSARGDIALDRIEHWVLDPQLPHNSRRRCLRTLRELVNCQYASAARLLNIALNAESEVLRIQAAWAAGEAAPAETVESFRTGVLDTARTDEAREQAAVALAFLDGEAAATALDEIQNNSSDPFASASARFGRWLAAEYKAKNELPNSSSRLFEHAVAHTTAGSWRTGIADCNEALEKLSDFPEMYCFRATCHAGLNQFDEAVADARKAVELEPDNVSYAEILAWAYERGDRDQDALAAYRDLARLKPDNAEYQAKLGWYAYRMGELQESIEASRRSSELGWQEPNVLFNLGLALVAAGSTADALFAYGFGLSLCSRLSSQDSESAVSDALGDLAELEGRRPELLPDIDRARQTLGKALKGASA